MLAGSASARVYPLRLKVLSSKSYIASGPSEHALEECAWRVIDGYCNNWAPTVYTVYVMKVQASDGETFRIGCTAYRWSHCVGLPVDDTVAARQQRQGFEIQYTDDHGKRRTQLYVRTTAGAEAGQRQAGGE